MRPHFLLSLALCVYLAGEPAVAREKPPAPSEAEMAAERDLAAADEQSLREAHVGTDAAELLDFFRTRTVDSSEGARIQTLIRQLGDDEFQKREEASRKLVAIGARARPWLTQAVHDPDVEIVRRAETCLRRIQRGGISSAVIATAARVLARRKPADAARVLLTYLSSAEDEGVAEEVVRSLSVLALARGRPEPVLVNALEDRDPVRRAAAGEAFALARLPEPPAGMRKLLTDPVPRVRRQVALALARSGDREAIPVLLALLGTLSPQDVRPIDDLLSELAGDKSPTTEPGTDAASRRKHQEAWSGWWKEHGARADLARLRENRLRGYTSVVLLDQGEFIDLDRANRPRWRVTGLQFPLDAQVIGDDRVLVAEYRGNRVTERNRKGEVVWEKAILQPLVAQRLPNGNTFIATARQLVEVDRDGKEVFTCSDPGGASFMRAVKLPDGNIACVTQLAVSRFALLDRDGKSLRSFGVDVRTSGGRIDVLKNGHVLIPEMGNNRVVEYDSAGKVVWEASVNQPVTAIRQPNGRTLVTFVNEHRAVELSRDGKEVWEYRTNARVTRALRR